MSHVTKIELEIHSLDDLKKACKELGLQFNEGKKTYKWYGRHVGDYPLPTGFTKADLGKCDHSISVPGKPNAYEVGVSKCRDGSDGYELFWDFWSGGHGLEEAVGKDGGDLQEEYAAQHTMSQLRKKGFSVKRKEIKQKVRA